jgi:two-component system, OmpR family, phosphate regulon sensor histidine kinase PhoR
LFPSRIGSGVLASAILALAGAMLALFVGYGFDREWGWITLAFALAVPLAWHLWQALRLGRWMERGGEPPRLLGLWDEMQAMVARLTREGERREVELAAALERWREAARALPEGVTLLEDDRIEWCNDMARTHLAVDLAKDAGRPLTHLVRAPEFARYLEAGDFTRPLEMRPPDGRVLSLQAVDYGPGLRLVLSRDVTRFDNIERMRREFVANVSHELRTPLTVISGFLENLRADRPAAHPDRRSLDLMDEQARRMLRLVEDLLTLSGLESSPPPPLEEAIDMDALLARAAADARALSAGRHRIETEGHPAVALMGSEKEIASALGNMVSNAVRYTPPGGTIRLRWRELPDGGEFEVEDSGIGIAPEHIARLTERFYRVDRGRSRETGGTGLGLAIVKHALSRHGATLHIASEPGKGSRFVARFTGSRVRALQVSSS